MATNGTRGLGWYARSAAILYTTEHLNLPPTGVRSAVSYYAAYPAEIDEWIARNDAEAEVAEAAWRREQAALA